MNDNSDSDTTSLTQRCMQFFVLLFFFAALENSKADFETFQHDIEISQDVYFCKRKSTLHTQFNRERMTQPQQQDIKSTFARFVAAPSVSATLSEFATLRHLCGLAETTNGLAVFRHMQQTVQPTLPFRSAQLFNLLQTRVAAASATSGGEHVNALSHLVIVGAGPVGLRAAVEAAMCGFPTVTVVERRADFSRLNVIKTWKVTLEDLLALGLKFFVPSQQTHGFTHCGTRDIQATLLKAALLLGVRFRFEQRVVGVHDDAGQWRVVVVPSPPPRSPATAAQHDLLSFVACRVDPSLLQRTSRVNFVEPAAGEAAVLTDDALARLRATFERVDLLPVTTLMVAEGERSALLANLGFSRAVTRYASAVGLVVNVVRGAAPGNVVRGAAPGGGEAVGVASLAAADWNSGEKSALAKMAAAGIKCENVEHLVSSEARFFVCTVMKETLIDRGVFIADPEDGTRIVIARENINTDALWKLARDVCAHFGFADAEFAPHNPVQCFDFSAKGELIEKARVLGDRLLVLPIGDALQSPFWPQGLGVNKGFHSAIDAVAAALAAERQGAQQGVATQQFLHVVRNYVAFFEQQLTAPGTNWSTDPTTRYKRDLFRRMHMDAVEQHKESPLTDELLNHFGWKR
jgi:hypothetical protein